MLRQENGFGCGMYAVANALNLHSFATDKRLELSKAYGNLTGRLDQWLKEDGLNFYLQPLYYDSHSHKLPSSFNDFSISGEILAMPLIFCVTLSDKGKSHMVGAHLDKSGCLYIYDSLKLSVFETTMSEINNHYHSVFGMFGFCDLETGQYGFIL